ncbi:lmo0954 family membrane protein [Salinibacillus xinjiangensis]|uniref:Flagellar basal body rod protein n=1 Tax=Salinibacillus xinjiangensis TaxID=1229268 RepID=A0A6G1X8P8_9BACI|nr:flagellar basal body rod protein [Salinibacillus xinjiangensis]MRG87317.1 flagellar basal body rod protein [Salinibacillus xinjiangensis]
MKKFILFVLGLAALMVLLANMGPMILLAVSVWLLYVVFKQFMKADSLGKKIGWTILGLFILSITFSNIFAVMGLVAAYGLYLIYKEWKQDKHSDSYTSDQSDPFVNFEREWAELNK